MDKQNENAPQGQQAQQKKGFFGKLVEKLDSSMKAKAQEQSEKSSCCGGNDGKGGKCC